MAKGVQLATAYISLNVNTNQVRGQIESAFRQMGTQGRAAGVAIGRNMAGGMKNSFGGGSFSASLFNPVEQFGIRWATRAGATIGTALKRSLVGALGALSFGSILGLGSILGGGLDRLKTLQRAEVQLSLKLPPQEISKVKDAVEKAVKDTPISLDAAMQAAPRLVNAGLNADEIERYTRAVANLSAATGGISDFERLDLILAQVRSKTKLTGEEMMQLIEAGVDVRGMLKQTFGWDDKTLERNLKKNKITIDEILEAADKTYPGLALKMGETFDGAMKNLTASAKRVGANFIAAILGKKADQDPLKDYAAGIGKITENLKGVEQWVTNNREEIHGFFTRAKEIVVDLAKAVENVIKFLNENKTVAMALGGVYAGWKVVSITATVAENLSKALDFADRLNRKKIAPATDALGDGSTTVVGSVGGRGSRGGRFGAVGRMGGRALRAIPFIGTAAILYDILTEIPLVRDLTDEIPGWFAKAKSSIADAFTSDKMKKFFEDAKSSASSFITNLSTNFSQGITRATDTIKSKLDSAVDGVKKKWDSIFGETGWFATQFKKLGDLVDRVRDVLGLGPATANAAPSPGGSAPFNPGPKAPTAMPSGPRITARATPGASGTLGVPGVTGLNGSATINTGPMKPGAQKPGGGVIKSAGTPYGLPPGTDTGGYGSEKAKEVFPPWVFQLGDRYGVKPSTYGPAAWNNWQGHQEGSGMNRGIDWVGTVEQMHAFAEALVAMNIPGLEQVIWQNPNTGAKVGKDPGDRGPNQSIDDYYRDDWAGHQDHVHTRFSQNLDLSEFAAGGGVWGAGSAKSDSIPAMLSNGEHVLTAEDVKAMGGQSQVYAFRNALRNGKIPGFAPGGAVDPQIVEDAEKQLYDLNIARVTAQKQLEELPEDATNIQRLQAEISASQTQRAWEQANADLPVIAAGGTPPDRSLQNNVFSTTEQARLALAQLEDLRARVVDGEDIPGSQIYAAEAAANVAQRERQSAIEALQERDKPINFLDEFKRTAGFTPTAAGNTGVAGTSSLSSIIGMGNEVVGGLIDTGASLLQTAAQAGITAGTMGAGAAAGPAAGAAASYGIQLGASVAKRLSSYGFQLASIGADSLIAQMFPLGAPRWLGYDYTGFAPNLGIQQAALTTIEKMGNQAIQRYFNPQGQAVIPPLRPQGPAAEPVAAPPPPGPQPLTPTQGLLQEGDPGFFKPPTDVTIDPYNPFGAGGGGGGGSWANGGAIRVYDEGGVLRPGDLALNASTRPERILTDKQWDAMSKLEPGQSSPLVKIDAIYGFSPEDVATQIESKQKLAMMRYAGRP